MHLNFSVLYTLFCASLKLSIVTLLASNARDTHLSPQGSPYKHFPFFSQCYSWIGACGSYDGCKIHLSNDQGTLKKQSLLLTTLIAHLITRSLERNVISNVNEWQLPTSIFFHYSFFLPRVGFLLRDCASLERKGREETLFKMESGGQRRFSHVSPLMLISDPSMERHLAFIAGRSPLESCGS